MRKLIYALIAFLFAVIGFIIVYYPLAPLLALASHAVRTAALIAAPLIIGLIGFILAPKIYNFIKRFTAKTISNLSSVPIRYVISSVAGLILGLIIAALIGSVVSAIGILGSYVSVALMLFFAYVGAVIGYKKSDDIIAALRNHLKFGGEKADKPVKAEKASKKGGAVKIPPKVLDTSVIIDARIYDIYRTGFIEGDLIIPSFVLEELRHIADSSDALKRNRGRRGLDILNKMRAEFGEHIHIEENNYPDIAEVDSKLLRLAQDLQGTVLTNDFNLNKVARFQGVRVLNINELAGAVKPVVLPGEEMVVSLIKEGKELNQGVAYLDDGTMIVVENGSSAINKTVYVNVTSVLQTSAGKMIFARPKLRDNGSFVEYEGE